jgi:hypothetical protein
MTMVEDHVQEAPTCLRCDLEVRMSVLAAETLLVHKVAIICLSKPFQTGRDIEEESENIAPQIADGLSLVVPRETWAGYYGSVFA